MLRLLLSCFMRSHKTAWLYVLSFQPTRISSDPGAPLHAMSKPGTNHPKPEQREDILLAGPLCRRALVRRGMVVTVIN